MTRVAVLASGSGTNLQAILDHEATLGDRGSAHVVLVASDHANAGALARARAAGITPVALDQTARTTGLMAILAAHRIEMVVLAGYLRLVPAEVVTRFRGRILNVHPAPLPAFGGPGMYGHRVHEAVVARGARLTGPTVHFVDERYDEGPVIAQWPVPVSPTDSPDDVARRVLEVEHILYPRVVDAVAAGRIRLEDHNRVHIEPGLSLPDFAPAPDMASLRALLKQGVNS
jgi:formyltetrahydrofolate-dependent phosphoribosylglycinamide formyltransferase